MSVTDTTIATGTHPERQQEVLQARQKNLQAKIGRLQGLKSKDPGFNYTAAIDRTNRLLAEVNGALEQTEESHVASPS